MGKGTVRHMKLWPLSVDFHIAGLPLLRAGYEHYLVITIILWGKLHPVNLVHISQGAGIDPFPAYPAIQAAPQAVLAASQ